VAPSKLFLINNLAFSDSTHIGDCLNYIIYSCPMKHCLHDDYMKIQMANRIIGALDFFRPADLKSKYTLAFNLAKGRIIVAYRF